MIARVKTGDGKMARKSAEYWATGVTKDDEYIFATKARAAYAAGERRKASGKLLNRYSDPKLQEFYHAGYHGITD
jgi:hypothetical protein